MDFRHSRQRPVHLQFPTVTWRLHGSGLLTGLLVGGLLLVVGTHLTLISHFLLFVIGLVALTVLAQLVGC